MNADDLWNIAVTEAKRRAAAEPILNTIKNDPEQALNELMMLMARIENLENENDKLKAENKKLNNRINELDWELNPERMGR